MRLYSVRHGQTNYNVAGLCNDDPTRDVHLTELGHRQAETAAARLRTVPLELIVVSPLPRTRETAEIINRGHGAPVMTHPAIHDIRSGFEGRPAAEYFACIAPDPMHIRPPGGESLADHRARVLGFLDWLAARPETTVLVVAHEETLRVLLARFRGLDDTAMRALNIPNCEIHCHEL